MSRHIDPHTLELDSWKKMKEAPMKALFSEPTVELLKAWSHAVGEVDAVKPTILFIRFATRLKILLYSRGRYSIRSSDDPRLAQLRKV